MAYVLLVHVRVCCGSLEVPLMVLNKNLSFLQDVTKSDKIPSRFLRCDNDSHLHQPRPLRASVRILSPKTGPSGWLVALGFISAISCIHAQVTQRNPKNIHSTLIPVDNTRSCPTRQAKTPRSGAGACVRLISQWSDVLQWCV